MSKKYRIYWLCQLGGWSLYGILQIFLYATARDLDWSHVLGQVVQVIFYIASTHFLRWIFIRRGWLAFDWLKLFPRVLGWIFVLSVLNYCVLLIYAHFTGELTRRDFLLVTILLNTFGPMVIYLIWIMVYFTFHYFERYDKGLKYEAAIKEMELRHLRSQLNPHFMFNALNSIRALVHEDPDKAKTAITQLSSILRNSLNADRQRLVNFSDELQVVKDYLALESIRYEERLHVAFEIGAGSASFAIPPLMLQTLVENGVKHGIANLKCGGEVSVQSMVEDGCLIIRVRNTGQYHKEANLPGGSGYGLENTKKRLELIYGDQATFKIFNESNDTVLTEISVPGVL